MTVIYLIRNKLNKKIYIGSAYDFKKRKNAHLRTLRNGTHRNIKLQRSFDKYGESVFEFQILLEWSKEGLIEKEQWYIDNLKPFYNINPKAGSTAGRKWSKETIEKTRKANTGQKRSQETKDKISVAKLGEKRSEEFKAKKRKEAVGISVYKYDLSGKFLESFQTVKAAARATGFDSRGIARSIKGEYKQYRGFIWKSKKEKISKKQLEEVDKVINFKKPVVKCDINGLKIEEFDSMAQAEKETNINARHICSCCKGHIKKAGGFLWKYK